MGKPIGLDRPFPDNSFANIIVELCKKVRRNFSKNGMSGSKTSAGTQPLPLKESTMTTVSKCYSVDRWVVARNLELSPIHAGDFQMFVVKSAPSTKSITYFA